VWASRPWSIGLKKWCGKERILSRMKKRESKAGGGGSSGLFDVDQLGTSRILSGKKWRISGEKASFIGEGMGRERTEKGRFCSSV